jgi:hypothetical protein
MAEMGGRVIVPMGLCCIGLALAQSVIESAANLSFNVS